MSELPVKARLYLAGCYVAGLAALGWFFRDGLAGLDPERDWLVVVALAVLAATSQVFIVLRSRTNYSDHLTPAALFAAFLLVPSPALAVIVCLTFVPEWIWYRRTWYIQTFNVASWLIALAVGQFVLLALTGQSRLEPGGHAPAGAIGLSLLAILVTQTTVLAWILVLARGWTLLQTGLFAPGKLFVELGLLCAGWALASAWLVDPLYGLAAMVPLTLIFQALHVPNLKEEASTDPKTGLANARHFNSMLERELERVRRNGQSVSLLMCDLDYLRNINNTYGHQAGDVVLREVADILKQNVRASDLPGRFGGEEFCILLVDTDSHGASQVAERIRRQIEQTPFKIDRGNRFIRATISIGVASSPFDGHTIETLMHEADLAVYKAKRDGRNRVVVAGRESRELAAEWAQENLIPLPANRMAGLAHPLRRFVGDVTRNAPAPPPPTPGSGATPTAKATTSSPPVARGSGAGRPLLPRPVAVFIALVVGASLAGLVATTPRGLAVERMPWPVLGFFAVATILAEQLAIDIQRRGKTSVTVTIALAASFLAGTAGSLATVATFALWAKLKAHSPVHRMLFNFGAVLLATETGTWTFNVLSGGLKPGVPFEHLVIPAICAGLIFYGVNHALLAIVRGLVEGKAPLQVWRDNYQWLWPYYGVFGALALVIAVGYQYMGWAGVVALMLPVGVMHLAMQQYVAHTSVYVGELERLNGRLHDSYEATLLALTRALDLRDEETEEHSQRVRRYTELIARRLGIEGDELEHILRGALLHDIGKIGVPDAILLKPGKLTEEEWAVIRKHPIIGYSMITHIPFLAKAAEIVLHHHEAFDGSGYPSGLAGERIPLGARIFALADTLDAMTSDRPYRQALPYAVALAEIKRCSGTQFDPEIVDALLSVPVAELRACAEGGAGGAATSEGLLGAKPQPVPLAS